MTPLTDAQKFEIRYAGQHAELWGLKHYQAEIEFERAVAALRDIVARMTPEGYRLNEQLDLMPIDPPKETPP